jgi:hypothetical protein
MFSCFREETPLKKVSIKDVFTKKILKKPDADAGWTHF